MNSQVANVEAQIRLDFPILSSKVNNRQLVYFDNAATSQKPTVVIDALVKYYKNYNSNVHRGVHTLSQKATDAYEAVRLKLKTWLNAPTLEGLIFTKGTTESINLVAYSYADAFLKEGDEVIVSELEHHANLVPWQLACTRKGAILKVIPVNNAGELQMDAFEKLLSPKTRLIAICHISNSLGTINPVAEIIEKAHANGTHVLIDGAQSAPHMPIDLTTLDCDFFAFSAHKTCGPTGVGVLYGKPELLNKMPPFLSGGDMIDQVYYTHSTFNVLPHKFEAGTPNIADVIAFGAAIDYLMAISMETIATLEAELLHYATIKMVEVPGIKLVGTAKSKASVVSFLLGSHHPLDVGMLLDKMGIAIRTGHHCTQPLMRRLGVPGTCRASFAFYNTKAEIDYFIDCLSKINQMLS